MVVKILMDMMDASQFLGRFRIYDLGFIFFNNHLMNTHQNEMLYFISDSEIDPKKCWVGATHFQTLQQWNIHIQIEACHPI